MERELKKNILKWLIFATAVILMATVLVVIAPSPSPAAPSISWSPASLAATLSPGETKTIPVSFVASQGINNANVGIVPELQSLVQVTPSTFGSIQGGQTVHLTVTMAAPITALPGSSLGTVRLLSGSKTIAQPLPVIFNVIWDRVMDDLNAVSFFYPTLGAIGSVDTQQKTGPIGPYTLYDVSFAVPGSSDIEPQYSIAVSPNPQLLSLTDWFISYVDPDSELLNAGVFTQMVLGNGMTVFVRTGPMPATFTDGSHDPVAEFYAISASRESIVVVGMPNGGALNLSVDTLHQEFLAMLSSMQVP